MAIVLSDDGTMDTVLRCTECGEEFRFNFQMDGPDEEPGIGLALEEGEVTQADIDAKNQQDYDEWVDSCIEEVASEHECAFHPDRDEEETE